VQSAGSPVGNEALVPPSLPSSWVGFFIPCLTLAVRFVQLCGEPEQYFYLAGLVREERICVPTGPWWGPFPVKRASND